jgi:beta-glucosidase-like glycosyl hydrolase
MAQIDHAVRLILNAKYDLGLFKDPYKYCDESRAKSEIFTQSHRSEARKIAAQSLVLLKNKGQILPLKKLGTIAVLGRSPMPKKIWRVPGVSPPNKKTRYPYWRESRKLRAIDQNPLRQRQ